MDESSEENLNETDISSRPAEVTCGLQCEMSEIICDTSDLPINRGSNLHKTKVIGRFIFYYLIIIALWIIENGFWLNKQILNVTYEVLLRTIQNKQITTRTTTTTTTTTVLFIFIGIILLGFLLGGTITSSACDD